jgi:adenylyl-sulfate kinase
MSTPSETSLSVGAVVWMTGLSGAGKSTLAHHLERSLLVRHVSASVLDGDVLRCGVNRDLGFSRADRYECVRRVVELALSLANSGYVAIAALISPYRADRGQARARVTESSSDVPFIEVFVDAPLVVCRRRDPKNLYARAQAGNIANFTGVSDPYEPPLRPEVHVRTDVMSLDLCVEEILKVVVNALGRERTRRPE